MPRVLGLNYTDVPIGSMQPFGGGTVPTGWVLCDGTSYLRAAPQFVALFAAIGTAFGAADGTHFNVPDWRGRFMRGSDNMGSGAAGRDPGDARGAMNPGGNGGTAVGSVQSDSYQGHGIGWVSGTPGTLVTNSVGYNSGATGSGFSGLRGVADGFAGNGVWGTQFPATTINDGTHGVPRVSTESRPTSGNANVIIKYA